MRLLKNLGDNWGSGERERGEREERKRERQEAPLARRAPQPANTVGYTGVRDQEQGVIKSVLLLSNLGDN